MTTQQALEILAEAINKAVACNLHSKAEIVGLQAAINVLNTNDTQDKERQAQAD